MKVTERDLKAIGATRLSDLYKPMEIYHLLCTKYDGNYVIALVYHLGRIHGIQQERARRHKKSPVTDQSKQGE